MSTVDLSIIIPARNEMFLMRTIQDIQANAEGNTELIVLLDGAWADPPIITDPEVDRVPVTILFKSTSIGQRAACNECAKVAKGKYVMKVDAHCAFDKGFDVKMLEFIKGHDDWTVVPVMRNLHVFDWVCPAGHRRYQGPSGPCKECGAETHRDIVWIPKTSPQSKSYCFDSEPHFQYFQEFSKRPEGQGDCTPTMSLQGSCFMMTRDKYFELKICDDDLFGSWGSQGIEVACKTWLTGGQVMVNHKTWYAHLFRTQGGDFGFPYPQSGKQVDKAKKTARDVFFKNKIPGQKYPLSWLIEKFWPVKGWTDEALQALKNGEIVPMPLKPNEKGEKEITEEKEVKVKKPKKGVIYYTHNVGDEKILEACREQIKNCIKEKHIVSASTLPINFGRVNLVYPKQEGKSGWLDMAEKIVATLEASDADVIFFTEHDVLYHPSHFDFIPERKDAYYYNNNVWKLRWEDGHALKVNDCKQLSGLVGWRETLLKHWKERVRRIKAEGFSRKNGFEPGTRKVRHGGYDDLGAIAYYSKYPNVDIRHGSNSTQNRWRKDQFRNQKYTEGWTESENWQIPGWPNLNEFCRKLMYN